MSDQETIERTAKTWIECGGDAEGLKFSVSKLVEAIEKLTEGGQTNAG